MEKQQLDQNHCNFTTDELEEISRAVNFVNAFKSLIEIFSENIDLRRIKKKLTAYLGNPVEMLRRANAVKGMEETYKDDPKELEYILSMLDKDYPLPPAYRH